MSLPRVRRQRRFVVATAGLGLLAQTRLKAACALLMADRLHVDVVPWSSGTPDLLMADLDDDAGREARDEATRDALPILAVSRSTDAAFTLSPNATVKDLAHELKLRIQSVDAPRAEHQDGGRSALLEKLRLDDRNDGQWLLELGLTRVVVDLSARQLHLLRHVTLDNLLREASNPHWHATALSEAAWLSQYQRDTSASFTVESFWWRLAASSPGAQVDAPADDASLQLTAWPDLDPQSADPALLIPLSYLMHGSWTIPDIVRMTQLSRVQAEQLLAIVAASGLAQGQPARVRPPGDVASRAHAPGALAHSLMKVARRFGLLFGARHV